ncbi:MAG: CDGSH iron-sulfur domain-containing protein [Phycisphaerales bacterium]|nr:CDGSH iron-sulfur domain-containing protein [Phycisphaerales bacterium]
MARLVKFAGIKPIKVEPQDKPIFVCACGLSQKFPLCDGHHKGCAAEEAGRVYEYDAQGENPRDVTPATT